MMVDYRKFDHIDTDSEEDNDIIQMKKPSNPSPALNSISTKTPTLMTKKGKEGRLKFEYDGRVVYEWDQTLEEVNIYIVPPENLPRNLIEIKILHKHLSVGLKVSPPVPPFLDEDTGGPVKIKESMWTYSDGEININLQKMNKAEMWDCALVGKSGAQLDAYTQEEVKKKLMLERFQEEHPGFDFSGADFNGSVPNAREFMGGVKYF